MLKCSILVIRWIWVSTLACDQHPTPVNDQKSVLMPLAIFQSSRKSKLVPLMSTGDGDMVGTKPRQTHVPKVWSLSDYRVAKDGQ